MIPASFLSPPHLLPDFASRVTATLSCLFLLFPSSVSFLLLLLRSDSRQALLSLDAGRAHQLPSLVSERQRVG